MVRLDFRPVTLILIWWYRARRALRLAVTGGFVRSGRMAAEHVSKRPATRSLDYSEGGRGVLLCDCKPKMPQVDRTHCAEQRAFRIRTRCVRQHPINDILCLLIEDASVSRMSGLRLQLRKCVQIAREIIAITDPAARHDSLGELAFGVG